MAQRLVLDYRIPAAAAAQLVTGGQVLPVLDGLDEMDPEVPGPAGPARALALLRALNAYGDLGRPAPVVVTCRAGRYAQIQAAGPALLAGHVITIGNLDTACLHDYLHARYSADSRMLARWEEVLFQLREPAGAGARRVLATPWRLLLAITAAEDGHDPRRLLAGRPGEAPAAAEQRIPAATRLARRSTRYQPGQVDRWLRVLAAHLEWQATTAISHRNPPPGMTGVDIVPHLVWPAGGIRLVRVMHTILGALAGTAAAAAITYSFLGALLRMPLPEWASGMLSIFGGDGLSGIIAAASLLAVVAGIPAYAVRRSARRWPAPNLAGPSVRFRRFNWNRFAAGLTVGLTAGFAAGFLIGFESDLASRAIVGVEVGDGVGALSGITAGIMAGIGLTGGRWLPDATVTSPMHALRRQLRLSTALALGIAVGFVLTVSIAGADSRRPVPAPAHTAIFAYAVEFAFVAGAGIAGGLIYGSSWSRYVLGLACTASRRRLPLRLGRFLSWADESGLLRASGATYQFRHRELQDWLSARTTPAEPAGQLNGAPAPLSPRASQGAP
jgi:hypothetical protein